MKLLISTLVGTVLAVAAFAAAAQTSHYGYLLFPHGKAKGDTLAKARRALPAQMEHHRLSDDPCAVRAWNGQGPVPLALELRDENGPAVDEAELFTDAVPLRRLLGVPAPLPVKTLAVVIGAPRRLDVGAYAEALRLTRDIAHAIDAVAFADGETSEVLRTANLHERLTDGLHQRGQPVSSANPPRLHIMEGITAFKPTPEGGLRTYGLRKLGLPDVLIADWLPSASGLELLEAAGNLLVSGKISPRPDTTFTLTGRDSEVRTALHGIGSGVVSAPLRFGTASTPQLLTLEFPGPTEAHVYERQALFLASTITSPYLPFGADGAREVVMAIARTQSRLRELRDRFASLQAAGARVFVATRMDLVAQDLPRIRRGGNWLTWDEVVSWEPEGVVKLRRWTGDPRTGGSVFRHQPPLKVGDTVFEYSDSTLADHMVEDILLIDRSGTAQGGEVTALVARLIVATAR